MRGEQERPLGRDHPFFNHMNPRLGRLLSQREVDKEFVRGEGCYLCGENVVEMGRLAESHGFRSALIHSGCKPLQT